MTDPLYRTQREDFDHLQRIVASTYQIAGAYDAPEHVLDVLANPLGATDEQVDALLPFAVPRPVRPAVTPFGRTYEDHLEQATRWLDSQKARLHHKDCTYHEPSAACSCGLHMCLTNLHAVVNTIKDAAVWAKQPAETRDIKWAERPETWPARSRT